MHVQFLFFFNDRGRIQGCPPLVDIDTRFACTGTSPAQEKKKQHSILSEDSLQL